MEAKCLLKIFLEFTKKKKKTKRLFLKDTKKVVNPILGTYTYVHTYIFH